MLSRAITILFSIFRFTWSNAILCRRRKLILVFDLNWTDKQGPLDIGYIGSCHCTSRRPSVVSRCVLPGGYYDTAVWWADAHAWGWERIAHIEQWYSVRCISVISSSLSRFDGDVCSISTAKVISGLLTQEILNWYVTGLGLATLGRKAEYQFPLISMTGSFSCNK